MMGMAEIEETRRVCQRCHGALPEPARYGPHRKFCSKRCADAATRTRPGRGLPIPIETADELLAYIDALYG
jgi:hypothetical protein